MTVSTIVRAQQWEALRDRVERNLARAEGLSVLAQAGRVLGKFDPDQPRDESGKWTSGGGGGGGGSGGDGASGSAGASSASSLLQPTSATTDSIIAKIPGAAEKIALAREKLASGVPTNATVAEGGFRNPDGSWTAERAAVHEQILGQTFSDTNVKNATPEPGEQPTLHLLGGRGGSGKSWFTGPNGTVDPTKAIVLNNDDFKEALPGYQGWNAALLHEESRELGKTAEAIARERGLNVVLDGTMRRDSSKRIQAYKDAGYKIEGHYMFVSPEVSTERAIKRFMNEGGRYVPPEYTLGSRSNEASFDGVKGQMDRWQIYDNSGTAPRLHSRSG